MASCYLWLSDQGQRFYSRILLTQPFWAGSKLLFIDIAVCVTYPFKNSELDCNGYCSKPLVLQIGIYVNLMNGLFYTMLRLSWRVQRPYMQNYCACGEGLGMRLLIVSYSSQASHAWHLRRYIESQCKQMRKNDHASMYKFDCLCY